MYKIFVSMLTPEGKEAAVKFNVDSSCRSYASFAPYDECDSPRDAAIFGGVTQELARRIDADRERLTKEIAEQVANSLIEHLKQQDKRNGYTKEEQAKF